MTEKQKKLIQQWFDKASNDLRIEPVLIEDSNDKSEFLKEIKDTGIEIYSAVVPH